MLSKYVQCLYKYVLSTITDNNDKFMFEFFIIPGYWNMTGMTTEHLNLKEQVQGFSLCR